MKIKTQEVKKKILKTLQSKIKDRAEKENAGNNFLLEDDPVYSDNEDNESLDSDQELQLAFARKELTPGLNIQVAPPKEYKNDREGMERKLKNLFLNMDWIERLDVTVSKESMQKLEKQFRELQDDGGIDSDLTNNDFKRESMFLKQAELTVVQSLPKLEKFGVKTKRPEDYFAEMAKSDNHMKKVREHLLSKHAELEKRDKIRKMRELKKMGKQIQVEVIKKKEMAKKKLNEKVKKFKKGDKTDNLDILLEEDDDKPSKKRKAEERENGNIKIASKKTKIKEQKYGFGGRKKRSKYNTAESYAEAFKNPEKKNKKGGGNAAANGNGKFGGRSKFSGGGGGKFNKNKPKKFINKNKPKNK